jgi:hypothetical protein
MVTVFITFFNILLVLFCIIVYMVVRGVYRVLVGKTEGDWGDPGVDGRILRRILSKWDVGVWTGLS